jgi:hypothetical protein
MDENRVFKNGLIFKKEDLNDGKISKRSFYLMHSKVEGKEKELENDSEEEEAI